MGKADFFRLGDWNVICDRCGRKRKGSEMSQMWYGTWVCPEHWEPRQPQDFVKALPENPTPPFVRQPAPEFVLVCTPNGSSAIPGVAMPGCVTPGFIHPAYDPAVTA